MREVVLRFFACSCILFFGLSPAMGALQVVEANESAHEISVRWDWQVEETSTASYNSEWWTATLTTTWTNPNWTVNWKFEHLELCPGELPLIISESQGQFKNDVFGQVLVYSGVTRHQTHFDEWSFTFDRSMSPTNTVIDFHDIHTIPEPGTLALMALGGLALIRRRRG